MMEEEFLHSLVEYLIEEVAAFFIFKFQGIFNFREERSVLVYSEVTLFHGVQLAAEVSGVLRTSQ